MFSHPFSCVVFLKSKEWCWYHSYPENQPSECQLPQVNIYKYLYLTLQSIKRGGCQSQSPGVSDHEEANPWMHWIHNSQGSWAKCEIIYIYTFACACARVCVCVCVRVRVLTYRYVSMYTYASLQICFIESAHWQIHNQPTIFNQGSQPWGILMCFACAKYSRVSRICTWEAMG